MESESPALPRSSTLCTSPDPAGEAAVLGVKAFCMEEWGPRVRLGHTAGLLGRKVSRERVHPCCMGMCVCAPRARLQRPASEPTNQTTKGTDGAPGKTGATVLSVQEGAPGQPREDGPCVRLFWERQAVVVWKGVCASWPRGALIRPPRLPVVLARWVWNVFSWLGGVPTRERVRLPR